MNRVTIWNNPVAWFSVWWQMKMTVLYLGGSWFDFTMSLSGRTVVRNKEMIEIMEGNAKDGKT